jgi:hypothetical protein
MSHTVSTIFKKKGEEGQTKKNNLQKKRKQGKASYLGAQRHTQERIEKDFFLDFVIL